MTADQVTAIAVFGAAIASPIATVLTWLLRFFIPAQGMWARFILWVVALGVSIYSAFALNFWPHLGWGSPTAVAESLGMILAFAGWVVAASKVIYEKMNVQAWPTASDTPSG